MDKFCGSLLLPMIWQQRMHSSEVKAAALREEIYANPWSVFGDGGGRREGLQVIQNERMFALTSWTVGCRPYHDSCLLEFLLPMELQLLG
jgi:hypothetical protein